MKTLIKKYITVSASALIVFACSKQDIKPNTGNHNTTKNSVMSSSEGGSLAQFTIIDDYLYTVDYKSIKIFDISSNEPPQLITSINLGVGIETIHANNDYLFVGTNSGVKIIDATNRTAVEEVSEFDHVKSCDPVVANSTIAASTLRGGTECGGETNELEIIDISNINNPNLITVVDLDSPYGLSFSKTNPNIVYVCDGASGVKGFDISDLEDVQEILNIDSFFAKDIIVTDHQTIIVLAQDGIHQFDASNEFNLIEKSLISIN